MSDADHTHENRIQRLETFREVITIKLDNTDEKLDDIRSSIKWLTRLIIGALLIAVLGATFGGNF